MAVSPLVRRRRLAAELRRLRANAGKSVDEAADLLECSASKLRRLETGQVGARVQDVRALLDCYGVTGPKRDALLDWSRQARGRGWWHVYSDVISEELLTYVGLEDEASSIATYEVYFIPALVQTERYAWAVMTARPDTPLSTVERGLELRRMRWRLLERTEPPTLTVLLDEGALSRVTGTPDVMTEQYERLIAVSEQPTVTLRVLPLSNGACPDGGFSFTLLGFTDPADPRIAYAELLAENHYTDLAQEVGRYQAAFDRLRAQALGAAESVALIKARAQELG